MKRFFSARETAELIGVSPRVLYELKRQNRFGKGCKVGRRLFFAEAEIQNFLDASNHGERLVTVDDLLARLHRSETPKTVEA